MLSGKLLRFISKAVRASNSSLCLRGESCPPKLGLTGIGVIALGLAIRAWLFITGRSVMDGDEGVMGVMAYHVATFKHFPIYFYRQHYLGTLEIPLVSLLMAMGNEAWKFSVWPIRLTEAVYFVGLCLVHFQLTARFFGTGAARWILFFLVIGPFCWMDFSSRLRHVTLMMLIGEFMALISLEIIGSWNSANLARRVRPGLLFALGLSAGLGWWHYQLIAVFFAPLLLFYLCFSSYARDLTRNSASASASISPAVCARLIVMIGSVAAIAGLSLGWGSRMLWSWHPHFFYPQLLAVLFLIVFVTCFFHARPFMRKKGSANYPMNSGQSSVPDAAIQRFSPLILLGGFLIGYLPAWYYLETLKEEFWVGRVDVILWNFWGRLRNLLLLDVASLLEIVRPVAPGSNYVTINARTYVQCVFYAAGYYLLLRKLIRPTSQMDRMGAAYFLAVLASIFLLHVVTPRPAIIAPFRFLLPLFAITSTMLGLLAHEISELTRIRVGAYPRVNGFLSASVGVLGAFALWGPNWLAVQHQAMDWPSGHRKEAVQIVQELLDHRVEKAQLGRDPFSALLGDELQFIARLKIRFNRGAMGDRLEGRVDEDQYHGAEYFLELPGQNPPREIPQSEGFPVGNYFAYPMPAKYKGRQER